MGSTADTGRESLGSRLGFLFISAGCAIGLGNVWRFPYITGKNGGGTFVLVYLFFLIILALPVMIMEFSVGRAAQSNIGAAFRKLEPKGSSWHIFGYLGIAGNYILMMFYTTVSGWMLAYVYYTVSGQLSGLSPDQVGAFFGGTLESASTQIGWMITVIVIGFGVCAIGLQNGVERITKWMMSGLFIIVIALAIRAVTLGQTEHGNSFDGLHFYLVPNWERFAHGGVWASVYDAMGQAFFTLSVGIGSMLIFGSYLKKERTLAGEGFTVMLIDTAVAILAGLVIFPVCFAFGQNPGAGPGLIFVTLPNVFNAMAGGQIWGVAFFIFMSFAAMTTVIAVFENLVSYGIDVVGWSRKKSTGINLIAMLILATPCALGFNEWAGFQPFGEGSVVLDLEDFIVSQNLLPLGSLVFVLFCCTRYGWGWDKFIAECDAGKGPKFPKAFRAYFTYILPIVILGIFFMGYYDKFGPKTPPPAPAEQVEEVAPDAAPLGEGAGELEKRIQQDETSQLEGAVEGAADAVSNAAQEAADKAESAVEGAADAAKEKVHDAAEEVEKATE